MANLWLHGEICDSGAGRMPAVLAGEVEWPSGNFTGLPVESQRRV